MTTGPWGSWLAEPMETTTGGSSFTAASADVALSWEQGTRPTLHPDLQHGVLPSVNREGALHSKAAASSSKPSSRVQQLASWAQGATPLLSSLRQRVQQLLAC